MTTSEAAQMLGVKRETLYAYVSRGLLSNQRRSGGRESLFRRADVTALADHLERRPGGHRALRFRTITSDVSTHSGDSLSYRGTDVAALVHDADVEAAASLVLGLDTPPIVEPLPLPPLLTDLPPLRRLHVAPSLLADADPRRGDISPAAVAVAGWRLTDAVLRIAAHRPDAEPGTWAQTLAAGWLQRPPHPAETRVVAAALILLMDHGLTASTVAARVAASTRATVYDCVAAAYATLAGPLHGGASLATTLLLTALREGTDPTQALALHRTPASHTPPGQEPARVPGFGHVVYAQADPRYVLLRHELEGLAASDAPTASRCLDALHSADVLHRHVGDAFPNIDLALACLAVGLGWPAWTGSALFMVARTVGCVAQVSEEYTEPPLRWRAQAARGASD